MLHTVNRFSISPGVSLTCIVTDKFKTGCMSINLITALRRDTASLNALLPRVLRRGCAEHPDLLLIASALDELYGARIIPIVRKKGEMHSIGLFVDFPDDRYIPDGGSVFEQTVNLAFGILLAPLMPEGVFSSDYVESEKQNLVDDIDASINDKRSYSIDRLIKQMCADESYGINKLGGKAETLDITPDSLTAHYHKLIADSGIEILFCGSAQPRRVQDTLQAALASLPVRNAAPIPATEVIFSPAAESPRLFTEHMDVTQGKLAVGFRLGRVMEKPDYPALTVFNTVYGGDVTSKLFSVVREKLSLCYYVTSMIDKRKGLMVVASGIDFSNYEIVLSEIQTQLDHVKRGAVSKREFLSAKRSVIAGIESSMDSLGGLEELYFDSSVSEFPYDPAALRKKVQSVTLERIAEIASGIEIDSIYFLTSKTSGEKR